MIKTQKYVIFTQNYQKYLKIYDYHSHLYNIYEIFTHNTIFYGK